MTQTDLASEVRLAASLRRTSNHTYRGWMEVSRCNFQHAFESGDAGVIQPLLLFSISWKIFKPRTKQGFPVSLLVHKS